MGEDDKGNSCRMVTQRVGVMRAANQAKRPFFAVLFFLLFVISCIAEPLSYQQFHDRFFESYWRLAPGRAAGHGNISFSENLEIPSQEILDRKVEFFRDQIRRSENVVFYTKSDLFDRDLIRYISEFEIWKINDLKEHEWNPSYYSLGRNFALIINHPNVSPRKKSDILNRYLSQMPEYYKSAEKLIRQTTRIHTMDAIAEADGLLRYLENDVAAFQGSQIDRAAMGMAKAAVLAFKDWLQARSQFRPNQIAPDLYRRRFAFEFGEELTPEELRVAAEAEGREVRSRAIDRAKLLWPVHLADRPMPASDDLIVTEMLAQLRKNSFDKHSFGSEIQARLASLDRFVIEKGILSPRKLNPLIVRVTPKYQINNQITLEPAGIFALDGNTYYNIPDFDRMKDTEVDRLLSTYNKYNIDILNIHEGIPGHFSQISAARIYSTLPRKLSPSIATSEGWAVYAEQLMIESGFQADNIEFLLFYDIWRLTEITNVIIDQAVHLQNQTESDFRNIYKHYTFTDPGGNSAAWARANRTHLQLSTYYGGLIQILALREKMLKSKDDRNARRDFNDRFVTYGSAPVFMIQKDMVDAGLGRP